MTEAGDEDLEAAGVEEVVIAPEGKEDVLGGRLRALKKSSSPQRERRMFWVGMMLPLPLHRSWRISASRRGMRVESPLGL